MSERNACQRGRFMPTVFPFLILLMVCCWAETVPAKQPIRDAFFEVYPNAEGTVLDTVPSFPGHCGVCHYDFSGGGLKNPYGDLLAAELENWKNN